MSGNPRAHVESALLAELIQRKNKNGESVDSLLPAFFKAVLAESPKEDQFRRELAKGFLDAFERQQVFATDLRKDLESMFLIPECKIKYMFFDLTGHNIEGNPKNDLLLRGYFEVNHPGCWKATLQEIANILAGDLAASPPAQGSANAGKGDEDAKNNRGKKKGRPVDTNLKEDSQIFDAWKTGQYADYEDLGRQFQKKKHEVGLIIDREGKRRKRDGASDK